MSIFRKKILQYPFEFKLQEMGGGFKAIRSLAGQRVIQQGATKISRFDFFKLLKTPQRVEQA